MEASGGNLSVRVDNMSLTRELPGPIIPIPVGHYVCVTVSDTGMGIPEAVKGRIFDPYFTTKAIGKGTGMGLSMVHSIMKNCGGGIVLRSKTGEGTTFELYFPLVDLPVDMASSKDAVIPVGSERILFVDDEAMIVQITDKILKRLGYQVQSRTDPKEALSLLKENPEHFDLIITDMTMPFMTGNQLVREIRIINPSVPVIICTGCSEQVAKEKIQSLDIDAVLHKPVELKKLAAAVRTALRNSPGRSHAAKQGSRGLPSH
jgi:CheY-like chemotaxis protein